MLRSDDQLFDSSNEFFWQSSLGEYLFRECSALFLIGLGCRIIDDIMEEQCTFYSIRIIQEMLDLIEFIGTVDDMQPFMVGSFHLLSEFIPFTGTISQSIIEISELGKHFFRILLDAQPIQ